MKMWRYIMFKSIILFSLSIGVAFVLAASVSYDFLSEFYMWWICLSTIFFIFFLPTYIALLRNHPDKWVVFMFNIIAPATIISWFVAFLFALRSR